MLHALDDHVSKIDTNDIGRLSKALKDLFLPENLEVATAVVVSVWSW